MLWDEKEAPKAKYIIPPIANIGNGPSGLTYNPGTGLSDKYQGHFFLSRLPRRRERQRGA